jgi:hypothetical protein
MRPASAAALGAGLYSSFLVIELPGLIAYISTDVINEDLSELMPQRKSIYT